MNALVPSAFALLLVGCAAPVSHSDETGRQGWPPNVAQVSPQAGPAGTVITLKGDYLDDARKVLVNGQPVAFTAAGAELQVTVPADAAPGTADVVVVVPGGTTSPVTFKVVR